MFLFSVPKGSHFGKSLYPDARAPVCRPPGRGEYQSILGGEGDEILLSCLRLGGAAQKPLWRMRCLRSVCPRAPPIRKM